MMLLLASAILTCAMCYGVIHIFMWKLGRRRLYEMAAKFEGPSSLPFIGNAHLFVGNSEYVLNKINEFNESYPSPVRVWLGPRLIFSITDAEQVEKICRGPNALGKGIMFTDLGRPMFGEGLLTAAVPKWKVHRKLIQPTFNTNILDTFLGVFATQSKVFNQKIEQHLDGPEFEVFNSLALCTVDMICETALGVKVGAQEKGISDYVEALQKNCNPPESFDRTIISRVIAGFLKRFFRIWLYPDFVFYRTKLGKDERKNIEYLHGFTDNVIRMKKKEFLERKSRHPGTDEGEDDREDETPRQEVFLDLLINMHYKNGSFSDEELREEADIVIVAGYDTSAVANSTAMLMLASHPDIQEKVYQELYEIYGDADVEERPITLRDLPRMKYLERSIKETMRLFPPIPYIIREMTNDFDMGECTLPKGSYALISILSLHRSEKYWPDPLKFDPDRFLPEESAKRHPYAYMPFGGGPRNCIGFNYAMMSMKTILATILRRYKLKKDNIVPVKDIRLKYEILLKTVDPIKVRIESRTRN